MRSRRRVLAACVAALSTVSGCGGAIDDVAPGGTRETTESPTTSGVESGQARGDADPLSLTRRITEDGIAYVPANDTVRRVRDGDATGYRYVPFDEWVGPRTAAVAAAAVRRRLDVRFGALSNVSVDPVELDGEVRVSVAYRVEVDDAGTVADRPSVDAGAVVDAVPGRVTVSLELGDRHDTVVVPVFVSWGPVVALGEGAE
jgi:hypothetical protein